MKTTYIVSIKLKNGEFKRGTCSLNLVNLLSLSGAERYINANKDKVNLLLDDGRKISFNDEFIVGFKLTGVKVAM